MSDVVFSMLLQDIIFRKVSRTHWRSCLSSEMQTQEFFVNSYCSEEFHQGLDNEILSLSVINVFLGITPTVGNIVMLIALHNETSLHKPSKLLLRSLVVSDLCVGFVQLSLFPVLRGSPFSKDGGKFVAFSI